MSVKQVFSLEKIIFLPYYFAQLQPKTIIFALLSVGAILLDTSHIPFHKLKNQSV